MIKREGDDTRRGEKTKVLKMNLVAPSGKESRRKGVHRVTPDSAVPELAVNTLVKEVAGKYESSKQSSIIESHTDRLLAQTASRDGSTQKETIKTPQHSVQKDRHRGQHRHENASLAIYTNIDTVTGPPLPPLPSGSPVKPPPLIKVDIVHELKVLLNTKGKLHPPKLRFDVSKEAAEFNINLLNKWDFNLEHLLNNPHAPSITTYGSEFKAPEQLRPLLQHHPRWNAFKTLLKSGSKWDLEEIGETERVMDSLSAASRGNHKSAGKNVEFLNTAMIKEIQKGW